MESHEGNKQGAKAISTVKTKMVVGSLGTIFTSHCQRLSLVKVLKRYDELKEKLTESQRTEAMVTGDEALGSARSTRAPSAGREA
ncbi:ATP-dependent DNA helicase Q1 [Dissostichus eleginoides]|uniref:ATP-dependent DNA helicase Q1 n=1 Tax=Dissostichus eleginoides TaxID=100907 RepID=A0AAD9BBB0_DISEL|nr:ATP-dependent DNA helicase Q1 [Dissostichus eleginoides]